jgi:protein-disulfide isomerase
MPARKTATKKPQTIGDLTRSLSQIKTNQILYVALLVVVFFLGFFVAKSQLIGGSATAPTTAGTQAGQPAAAPTLSPQDVVKKLTFGDFPVRGNKNAKVKLVEFADFRCPFCEQFFTNTESQLIKDYVDTGKVAYYFRQYAFLGPASTVAANAAACANEQGKFWDMHDYLYKNQPPETDTSMYTTDNLTSIAGTLGMDTAKFNSCLSANKYNTSNVQKDLSDGQAVGVSATPTFFINGQQILGAVPYATFKQIIEQELKK